MLKQTLYIEDTNELRQYVNLTLCEYCQLQLGAFEMTERLLVRGGEPCAIYFCLHGPRMTKFSAIWDMKRHQILFYGASGERFLRTQLAANPQMQPMAVGAAL